MVKIETVFSKIEDNKNSAEAILVELHKNKPTLLSISKDTGISRQTLYNNPVLKEYIEHSCSTIFEDPKDEVIKQLQDKIDNLLKTINKLQERDVQNEILHLENEKLRTIITNLERNELAIRTQKEEATKRLRELQKSLPKSTSEVSKRKSDIISIDFK